jgi:transcriptional regulator with XRE-family HTH domain
MNLKDIRVRKNLTQQAVAEYIGSSSVVYSRYERGTRQPSIETLLRLADLFDVTVDYLIGRRELEYAALSDYEQKLVSAARNADERAKLDALNMLLSHQQTGKKTGLA